MPRVKESTFICFNDGVLDVCEVENRALVRTKLRKLRYGNLTVGASRYWDAKIASSEIERMAAVLPEGEITTRDICVIGGKQYKILQVQEKFDAAPPCRYLSLSSMQVPYKDFRNE